MAMTRRLTCGLAVAALAVAGAACQPPPRYDIVVRGGTLVDGTGQPARQGDVGIIGDRIAFLGDLSGADADRVINAAGLVVAPGFINTHGRSGVTLLLDGQAESHVRQGITSEVIGDGGAPAYWGSEADEAALVEGFGVTYDWTGLDGYFTRLQERGVAINVGTLVPASAVWREVMGDADRAPSGAELARMEALVDEAMAAGALGVSGDLGHDTGRTVTAAGLTAMARAAARADGVLATGLRAGVPVTEAVDEVAAIARDAGARLVLFHLSSPATLAREGAEEMAARLRDATAAGLSVFGTMTPYADPLPAVPDTGGEAVGEAAPPDVSEEDRVAAGLRSGSVSFGTDSEAVRAEGALSLRAAPRSAYGTFPRVLGTYVRERSATTLEEAVRRMTSLAASQFGLERRGILRESWVADLVVFDPATIADEATVEAPQRYPVGIHHVLVNGVPVVGPDGLTGARPGRPIYGRARGR